MSIHVKTIVLCLALFFDFLRQASWCIRLAQFQIVVRVTAVSSRRRQERQTMNTHRLASVFLALVIFTATSARIARAQAAPLQMTGKPAFQGKAYRFDKIADGVYYATATGSMITGGNNIVIVNDRDVLLVDANTTPAAAREMLAEIKMITRQARALGGQHAFPLSTTPTATWSTAPTCRSSPRITSATCSRNHDVLHTEPYKTSVGTLPTQIDTLKKQAAGRKGSRQARRSRKADQGHAGRDRAGQGNEADAADHDLFQRR